MSEYVSVVLHKETYDTIQEKFRGRDLDRLLRLHLNLPLNINTLNPGEADTWPPTLTEENLR